MMLWRSTSSTARTTSEKSCPGEGGHVGRVGGAHGHGEGKEAGGSTRPAYLGKAALAAHEGIQTRLELAQLHENEGRTKA